MACRITMNRLDAAEPDRKRPSSFEVETETEALRVAREGVRIARERGMAVAYEVHDCEGRLVMLYTSTPET